MTAARQLELGTTNARDDGKRIATLLGRVRGLMLGGPWRTLGEIAHALGRGSEAGISARLRDLRKDIPGGGLTVERRRRGDPKKGLYEYRVREALPTIGDTE
jgi:hypothetical protein